MFELEVSKKMVNFDSAVLAENALGHAAANRLEAWLYLNGSTLAYSSGDGTVTDRVGRTKVLSSPLWAGRTTGW